MQDLIPFENELYEYFTGTIPTKFNNKMKYGAYTTALRTMCNKLDLSCRKKASDRPLVLGGRTSGVVTYPPGEYLSDKKIIELIKSRLPLIRVDERELLSNPTLQSDALKQYVESTFKEGQQRLEALEQRRIEYRRQAEAAGQINFM